MDPKYDPANLTLDKYDYSGKSGDEEELKNLPPLEGDEEKHYSVPSTPLSKGDQRGGKGLNILIPNKLLIRLQVLLAQIKAENNSNELKDEIRQVLYLFYQQNNITKNVYNNLIKPF